MNGARILERFRDAPLKSSLAKKNEIITEEKEQVLKHILILQYFFFHVTIHFMYAFIMSILMFFNKNERYDVSFSINFSIFWIF
jgi:hypothetical protein